MEGEKSVYGIMDEERRDGIGRKGNVQCGAGERHAAGIGPVLAIGYGAAGADDLSAGAELGEGRQIDRDRFLAIAGVEQHQRERVCIGMIGGDGFAAARNELTAGADIARELAKAIVFLGEDDGFPVVIGNGGAPVAGL